MKPLDAKESTIATFLYGLFVIICLACLWRYFVFLSETVPFEYDWLPTDGDHLNFAHRLAEGLPIYLSMGEGQVLSIYNPLYHALIAIIGGKEATLGFARSLSMFFWLACPLVAYLHANNKWGRSFALLAALFILLPPRMLLEIVQVNGDSLMAFLFFCTLVYCDRNSTNQPRSWSSSILLGVMAALCYLTKQQGIMAVASVAAFALFKEKNISNTLKIVAGFLLVMVPSTLYLESANHGQFLSATIFDLSQIMKPSFSLASERLIDFLIKGLGFSIVAVVALRYLAKNQCQFTVWHLSLLLHMPFLLKILGNAGGGNTYFLTFWFTLVMVGLDTARFASRHNAHSHSFLNPILILLCLNIVSATISIHKSLSRSPVPDQQTGALLEDYYQSIKSLVARKNVSIALTNRDIGALVANQVRVENEGCTMFVYAWNAGSIFNRDVVINAISTKKYDLITTGFSPYPEEVMRTIRTNYHLEFVKTVNLNEGELGPISVYSRN